MARPLKFREGTFLRIPLADGTFGYARAVRYPDTAFYRFRTNEPCDDLDLIEAQPVMFSTSVRVFRDSGWVKLGRRPLQGDVARPVVMFRQDVADFRKCVIFDTAGMRRACAPEECVGVECAGVWEARGIQERLLDELLGRPNQEEMRGRVRFHDD